MFRHRKRWLGLNRCSLEPADTEYLGGGRYSDVNVHLVDSCLSRKGSMIQVLLVLDEHSDRKTWWYESIEVLYLK
jgi:hypothetical protein